MRRFRHVPKYIKINLLMVTITIVTILGLTVGYSILSQRLDINSSILMKASTDIRINNVSNISVTAGGYEIASPSFTETTFTNNIGLDNLNSTATYTITVKNYGTSTMRIKSIVKDANNNANISYTINGVDPSTTFISGEEKSFTITYSYKNLSSVPIKTDLRALFEISFEEYVPPEDYVLNNLVLDLRGYDSPVNDVWYDRVSNKAMNLTSVIYNVDNKYYDFSTSGAYGKINTSIIPTTGNFTLEAYIELQDILPTASNVDQAIVAQISDTDTKDPGRIKFKLTNSDLNAFISKQSPVQNPSYPFNSNLTPNGKYLLQVVREDAYLKLYLNGVLVSTESYYTSNFVSSGPFKIARWTNNLTQQFTGKVHAVRVYSSALNQEQLFHNSAIDGVNYAPAVAPITLVDYAISTQVVTSGDGLYYDNLSRYVYRGSNPDNYLRILGDDTLYRIIHYNADGTIKLINTEDKYNMAFDASGNRTPSSTYCVVSADTCDTTTGDLCGCSAFDAADSFSNTVTTGSVLNKSTLLNYIDDTYYDTLAVNTKTKILNHEFAYGTGILNADRDQQNISSMSRTWVGDVGLLSVADLFNASISSVKLTNSNTSVTNYITSAYTKFQVIWTMSNAHNNTYDMYTISNINTVGKKRASRISQPSGNNTLLMYFVPTFHIDANVEFIGAGTIDNPFIIQ